jgi:DNA-binding protein H-NS
VGEPSLLLKRKINFAKIALSHKFHEVSMNNLINIQSQIAKLQQQAADLRSKEFARTIQDILASMQAFGITLKDLQAAMAKPVHGNRGRKSSAENPPKSAKKRSAKKIVVTVAPKYRGPNGETWSGRGLSPKWLKALIDQGRSKDEFLIKESI